MDFIGNVGPEQDGEEADDVGRDGEELGRHARVSERGDDGGEEETEGVDWSDDGEEIEGQEPGVDVEYGHSDPLPGEMLRVDL